jgi:hypothetical protein
VRLRAVVGMTVAVGALAVTGCRDVPPTAPKTLAAEPAGDPRAEGDAAAARGDWPTAVARYTEALQRTPNDMLLHFALGSALSHLDRTGDAIEHFVWVVEHGEPSRAEVTTARQWLRNVGALPATADATPASQTPAATDSAAQAAAGTGVLAGKTAWPGLDRHMPVRIRLRGETEATKDARDRVTIALGKPFSFPKVKAGEYRLLGEAAGMALWDVPVTVEPDKTTTVELSPANSAVPPAAFPPRG